jgi:hypothetical protein
VLYRLIIPTTLLLSGCYDFVPYDIYEPDMADVLLRLDALEADNETLTSANEALQARLEAVEADNTALVARLDGAEDDLDALIEHERTLAAEVAGIDPVSDDLTAFLAELETSRLDALEEAPGVSCPGGCVGVDELAGYATETWVQGQGYATSAALGLLTSRVSNIEDDYVVHAELLPFATEAGVGDLADRVVAIEQDYVMHSEIASFATEAEVGALDDRVSEIEGDYVVASMLDPLAEQAWVLGELDVITAVLPLNGAACVGLIDSDMTLGVPADFADVNAALDWLAGWQIAGDATVTIAVDAGTWVYDEAIVPSHANGDRIVIAGATSAPRDTVLSFEGPIAGLELDYGNMLRYVRDLTIRKDGSGVQPGVQATRNAGVKMDNVVVEDAAQSGVLAGLGGVITGTDLTVEDPQTSGFQAIDGGIISARESAVVRAELDGFSATVGGVVNANGSSVDGGAAEGASGFWAGEGGMISAIGASATNVRTGFYAHSGSMIDAYQATAGVTSDQAFTASVGSVMAASASSCSTCGSYGYVARYGSFIYANSRVSGVEGIEDEPAATSDPAAGAYVAPLRPQ